MINSIHENETMEAFYNLIPYFEHFLGCDLGFTISNTERFLYASYNDSFKKETKSQKAMPKVGDPIPPNSAADVCLKRKEKIHVDVPEVVFGMPVRTAAIPIIVDGNVEGTIVMAISKQKQREAMEMANTLSESLELLSNSTADMTKMFEDIEKANLGIEQNIAEVNDKSKETDEIINFVMGIAKKTNLLGLNAAIEATRVGEAGKGFGIVANEVRNLSINTKQSAEDVKKILDDIKLSISEIRNKINSSNELLESQVTEVEEMVSAIQKLNDIAGKLKMTSENL